MCPTGAPCLSTTCCFSEQYTNQTKRVGLVQGWTQSSSHRITSCRRHKAEKLPRWH
jgi:hypothetical protein